MILPLLLRQSLNSFRQLGLWHQLQSLLLWGFVVLAASYYLQPFVENWQKTHPLFYLLVINGFLVYLLAAFTYYLTRRLPGQLPLSLLRSLPLSTSSVVQILAYYLHRNWSWGWLAFFLFGTAEIRTDLQTAILFAGCFVLASGMATFFSITALLRLQNQKGFLVLQLGTTLLLSSVSALFFLIPDLFGRMEFLFLLLLPITSFILYKNARTQLECLYPLLLKNRLRPSVQGPPLKSVNDWLALLKRNFYSLWRDAAYRKQKALVLISIPLLGQLFFALFTDRAVNLFTFFVLFLIWWHYGQFFTPQYGQREPEWFFKTLQLNFLKYFTARFLVEFGFILLLLSFFSFTLHLAHIPITEHWQLLFALFLAAAVILISMMSFQIIFFDDPATAGFTFHFSILFFLILTLWDNFLGPLVSLVFLSFYLFKSYRFLRS